MESIEIEALKKIFMILNDRISGLSTLRISIKRDRDGDIEVSYSTSNSGHKSQKIKIDDVPKISPKKKTVPKGKVPTKSNLKKNSAKVKKSTKWDEDEKLTEPNDDLEIYETDEEEQ